MKSKFLRLCLFVPALLCAVRGAESGPLGDARARLEELRQKYADNHPAIIEQKAKIAALEKQITADSGRPVTFSIDFPGGTISEFFDAVSTGKGVSLSIINAGDQADLATRLPPFSLRNTNAVIAIQVLSRLLEPRGFNLNVMASDANSVAAVLTRHDPPRPRTSPIEFESFQLAPYLADQSIDDIVGAIRASWELNPKNDPDALRLKFHPPTSILLASGPRDALNMAGKIISQLKFRPEPQKPAEANRTRLDAVTDAAKK